jgi:lipopolysaccharide transport system ATP-binding protein
VTEATAGEVYVDGKVRALLSTGVGFRGEFTGRENILFGSLIMGIPAEVARARMDDIIDFAELREHIDQPTMFYSSGMRTRLAFAVALQEQPEILMLDEALSAGDAFFQSKCAARINEICSGGGTVIVVTHSLQFIETMCNRAILLESGRIAASGDPATVVDRYRESLLEHEQSKLETIPVSIAGHAAGEKAALEERGRVELLDAWMCGSDGERRQTFDHGEPLELHLRLAAEGRLPLLRFTLDVFANDSGTRITNLGTEYLSSATGDLAIFPLPELAGEYDLCMRWPHNPLGSGNYYWILTVRAFDASAVPEGASPEYLRTGRISPFRSLSFPRHPVGLLRLAIIEPEATFELVPLRGEQPAPAEASGGVGTKTSA